MSSYEDLSRWIVEALRALGGSGSVVGIAKHIWAQHENELRARGDFFYVWQYAMRWEGQKLQKKGVLTKKGSKRGEWSLKS